MLGHLSASALAGVGIALQIILLTLAIVLTFVVGASIVILRYLGKKDYFTANHVFAQSLAMGLMLSVVIAVIWYFGGGQIFSFIEGDSKSAQIYGLQYLRLIAYFAPLIIMNFISLGILRTIGDSFHTMVVNVSANIINLVLAPFLIFGWWIFPRLEVTGAAIAVIVSQLFAFVVTFYLLRSRKVSLFLPFSEFFAPNFKTFVHILKLGFPTTIEQFVWAMGQLILSIYVAQMGVIYLAVHQIFVRLQSILTMFFYGLGTGSMSMMGKLLGSSQFKQLNKTAIISALSGIVLALSLGGIIMLFKYPLLRLFTSDTDVLELGMNIIFILALVQIPKAANIIFSNNLRAAADNTWLMTLAIISVLIFEITGSYFLAFYLNLYLIGIWLIQGLDEFFRLILNNIRFFRFDWKYGKIEQKVELEGKKND